MPLRLHQINDATPVARSIGARRPSIIIFRRIEGTPLFIRCLPTTLRPLLVWGTFTFRIRHLGGSLAKGRCHTHMPASMNKEPSTMPVVPPARS